VLEGQEIKIGTIIKVIQSTWRGEIKKFSYYYKNIGYASYGDFIKSSSLK